jgi:hypothetical protein
MIVTINEKNVLTGWNTGRQKKLKDGSIKILGDMVLLEGEKLVSVTDSDLLADKNGKKYPLKCHKVANGKLSLVKGADGLNLEEKKQGKINIIKQKTHKLILDDLVEKYTGPLKDQEQAIIAAVMNAATEDEINSADNR